MITVLQMARLPNIRVLACLFAVVLTVLRLLRVSEVSKAVSLQVASALLSAAFVYDIFWVFISPLVFHESVMIAVSAFFTFTFTSRLTISYALVIHINLCNRFSS